MVMWQTWLENAYNNNISALNAAWDTNFKSFQGVGRGNLEPQPGQVTPAELYDYYQVVLKSY
jgi:beta-galactosidase GanA